MLPLDRPPLRALRRERVHAGAPQHGRRQRLVPAGVHIADGIGAGPHELPEREQRDRPVLEIASAATSSVVTIR
jgi:hypothetical protein